jgi:hypothetical protein
MPLERDVSPRSDPPTNLNSLTARINNVVAAQQRPLRRVQRAVANTAIGQMIPSGVVKGGTGIKLRVGEGLSRFTPDFDLSRPAAVDIGSYIDDLQEALSEGWGGFTGTIQKMEGVEPEGVPEPYIMVPYRIRLAYRSREWLSVTFELGHDEVGSTSHYERRIASDIVDLFEGLGLETPQPIPVMALDHQVAQKLHACTSVGPWGGNDRAHDLVDLQILDQEESVEMAAVGVVARRLFDSRGAQDWPPTVVAHDGWDTIYAEAAVGLGVLPDVTAAVEWANDFIGRVP